MKNQKCFIFDLNRCTGCGACVIACATENMEKQTVNWRDIHTFNETHHPVLPLFNLSMACNHCIDAACKKGCPALAYTKDKETGAVVHHADCCMGCTYCTWACPYDAPRYSGAAGWTLEPRRAIAKGAVRWGSWEIFSARSWVGSGSMSPSAPPATIPSPAARAGT